MSILIGFLTAIHVVVAIFLMVLVLMQKSKDQGVGAAFGGAVTETVFGAGTTTALVRMTIWCACVLLVTSLTLAVLHSHRGGPVSSSLMEKALQTAPAAPASAPAASQPLALPPTQQPAPAPAQSAPAPAPATPAKPAAPAGTKP